VGIVLVVLGLIVLIETSTAIAWWVYVLVGLVAVVVGYLLARPRRV